MVDDLTAAVTSKAREEGFDIIGFADPMRVADMGRRLLQFVGEGRHGDMAWLAETAERRAHPHALWPEARSAIMLGMNYGPALDPMSRLENNQKGVISVYALGRDYHDVIKKRLKAVARWLAAERGVEVKVFVDTAPLMEKPLAESAGIGWQGKHTNLVSREFGSWLFLGAILTTAELVSSRSEDDHCGSCRACLDICPTNAFPAPYQIDARRCISYLTIEHKGHIGRQFRKAMGNRIFGCDDCLAVCPWNKYARQAKEANLAARDELLEPDLVELAKLDDAGFRSLFRGSPVKRVGRDRFVRNVLVALGNSGDLRHAAIAESLLDDPSPLVRAMAVWTLGELNRDRAAALKETYVMSETDENVLIEWDLAA